MTDNTGHDKISILRQIWECCDIDEYIGGITFEELREHLQLKADKLHELINELIKDELIEERKFPEGRVDYVMTQKGKRFLSDIEKKPSYIE